MAYTKIFSVSTKLKRAVGYAADPDKTELADKVEYALDAEKTYRNGEKRLFQSALNCPSPETAYDMMMDTKRRFDQTDGILAYHIIQSFAHDEVTPEQAHEIGMEFARRMFGDEYQIVVGTHLDKQHLHSHIVVNSVNRYTGKKYHSTPASYFRKIRGISDELCREQGLSVIKPRGRGKHYAEWAAEQAGTPTVRGLIKADVDDAINNSLTFNTFIEQMKRRGYAVKWGPNVKHMAVKPQGGQRNIRLYSLGEEYTEDAIRERIAAIREGRAPPGASGGDEQPGNRQAAIYRFYSRPHRRQHPKLKGFAALYWHYCYLLKTAATRKLPNRAAFVLREDIRKFDQYQQQFLYLYKNGIEDLGALRSHRLEIERRIEVACEERRPLYSRRKAAQGAERESLDAEIDRLGRQLKADRRDVAICRRVEENSARVQAAANHVDGAAPETSRPQPVKHDTREKRER